MSRATAGMAIAGVAGALVAGSDIAALPTSAGAGPPAVGSIRPAADAWVRAVDRRPVHHRRPRLEIAAHPTSRAYLKFRVGGMAAPIGRVRLWLRALRG